jgi:hypothetical protein
MAVASKPPTKAVQADLERLAVTTQMMREHSAQVKTLSAKRRTIALRLRDKQVTYKAMAEAMGITEVAVFKILKGDEGRVPPRT